MKRLIHLVVVLLLATVLAACAPAEEEAPEPTAVPPTAEPAEEEPAEEEEPPAEEEPAEEETTEEEPMEEEAEPTEEPAEEETEPTAEPTEEPAEEEEPADSGSSDDVAFSSPATNEDWEPVTETVNGVEFVLVPTGTFTMGREGGARLVSPTHEQTIEEPFWIARTETTVAQWQAAGFDASNSFLQGDDEPVAPVTWSDARDYCASLGGRLPTEVEWAYAGRGPSSWLFPNFDTVAEQNQEGYGFFVYAGNAGSAVEVGSFPENATWVGALDMLGNVSEWTVSNLREYPYVATDGREDTDDPAGSNGQGRVHRGGSYQTVQDELTLAVREFWTQPNTNIPFQIGVRCVVPYGGGE